MNEKLRELRGAIDKLDTEILQLISDRMTLSDEVIVAKNGRAAFRPGREAALIRRLLALESNIAPSVLLSIWRQIMTASLTRQNNQLKFVVHKSAMPAAIWHMGDALNADVCDDYESTLTLTQDPSYSYGLVPAIPDDYALVRALLVSPHLHIIARTPLFPIQSVSPAYMLGRQLPDESGNDVSLFAVPAADKSTKIVEMEGYFADYIPK